LSVIFLTEHKKIFFYFCLYIWILIILKKILVSKITKYNSLLLKKISSSSLCKKIFKGFISQLRHFGMWKRPFPFFSKYFFKDQQSLLFTKTTISLLRDRNCTFGYQGNKIYVFNHKLGNWKTDVWKVFLWKMKGANFFYFYDPHSVKKCKSDVSPGFLWKVAMLLKKRDMNLWSA